MLAKSSTKPVYVRRLHMETKDITLLKKRYNTLLEKTYNFSLFRERWKFSFLLKRKHWFTLLFLQLILGLEPLHLAMWRASQSKVFVCFSIKYFKKIIFNNLLYLLYHNIKLKSKIIFLLRKSFYIFRKIIDWTIFLKLFRTQSS